MRKIESTGAFRRDFKREKRSGRHSDLDTLVASLVSLLTADDSLSERHRDHALTGNWRDFRECHLKPDLLLIYRKTDENTLQLVRMGSHSELFE